MKNYDPVIIEQKWQNYWEKNNINITDNDYTKPKYYVLEMLPYPSGNIHMGHVRNYTIGDVIARLKKAQGFNVLHPLGWDAFGLPAENAAIQNNSHPKIWTYSNIAEMKKEIMSIGLMYDWNREFATCDPDYYKHEQEFFIDFFEKGLVYKKESMVNWDPVDQTVLANEQVVDGRGWRSGAIIERRLLSQWFLKITNYADELLDDLKNLEWPEKVITMQEKWIGKSEGMFIDFSISNPKNINENNIKVYTTRHDTLFGASFIAISFQHPIAEFLANNDSKIKYFILECNKIGVAEEAIEKAEKQGIYTNIEVEHPLIKGKTLPVYIANFVLMNYGTGAVFACPAHDQRDLDFALKYNLPVLPVIKPKNQDDFVITDTAYTDEGILFNSEFLNGLTINQAKEQVKKILEEKKIGQSTTQYRLRDWGVSRQRYWGCPIPIINCSKCGSVPVNKKDLPISLPDDVEFTKSGNPLDHHPIWKYTKCPKCKSDAVRETDTLDTFFESSWYFARYCDNKTDKPLNKEACQYWMPVDQYIGGIEHAVMHLLYARFFTKALRDCGYLNFNEPFKKLLTQGMICHATFKDSQGNWVIPYDVIKDDKGNLVHKVTGENITQGRIEKMSKSKKNVIKPLEIIENYGADTARLFILSDSPPERDLEWSDEGIEGSWRFLNKLWNFAHSNLDCKFDENIANNLEGDLLKVRKKIHSTIINITSDLENFHLNKAVARIRELSNEIFVLKNDSKESGSLIAEGLNIIIRLIYPMIPHIACQLWEILGNKENLVEYSWPKANDILAQEDEVTLVIQVNGKLRARLNVEKDLNEESVREKVLANENVRNNIEGKSIKKFIYVPNKIVNIVI